jgi:hypothetical protein
MTVSGMDGILEMIVVRELEMNPDDKIVDK